VTGIEGITSKQLINTLVRSMITSARKTKNTTGKRRNRRTRLWSKINNQYRTNVQSMGPGTTLKNFERTVDIEPSTLVAFDINSLVNYNDDFQSCCRHYKYLKIEGLVITQTRLNMTNEQSNVYVRVAWSGNIEQQEDIEQDDATKIMPNIGTKAFKFIPPNAQISYYRNSNTITLNLRKVVATEHLIQLVDDKYKIPGMLQIYNSTTQTRKLRTIIRIKFIGNTVIDQEQESKNVLKQKGYLVTKTVPLKIERTNAFNYQQV